MIDRFMKVDEGIYRGSAPTVEDVIYLHKKYGIKKIISLDADCGNKIDRICQLLKIKHLNLPLHGDKTSLLKILQYDICDLLNNGKPTYVHCLHGKDRTGFLIALYKVKCMGWTAKKAIKEAEFLHFGTGLKPITTKMYKKVIESAENKIDENKADIVNNERNGTVSDFMVGDINDSYLDQAGQSSFAPFMTTERIWPFNQVYNYVYDQNGTRNDRSLVDTLEEKYVGTKNDGVPAVGLYDNSVIKGVGPVENGGGFVNY